MTAQEARALDRQAARLFRVSTRLLMENAGARCAGLAWGMARRQASRTGGADATRLRVLVLCGPGGNGGDGFVVARHLALAGARVRVERMGTPRPGSDAADALAAWDALRAPSMRGRPHVVVDAILGTGVDRPVAGDAARLVQRANAWAEAGVPVLSVDLPSGLHADTGECLGVAVRATVTATIAARKQGLVARASAPYRGRVIVVPFGAPASLVRPARR